MILKSLNLIAKELNSFLDESESPTDPLVILGNIAHYDNTQTNNSVNSLHNKIVLTLINAQQENTLKNIPNYTVVNGTTEYKNPPLYLNLYVLISSTNSLYNNALTYLSRIVTYFQDKNIFTIKDSLTHNSLEESLQMKDFRLIVDLYSPTFEEINFLWSTLGGKQLPSVIYKIRMIELKPEDKKETRGLIKEIEINEKPGN